ncbi:MAG: Magnesium and cobalt transport protein CorA, partial [uncultured Acetobacteraceae bacterium]
ADQLHRRERRPRGAGRRARPRGAAPRGLDRPAQPNARGGAASPGRAAPGGADARGDAGDRELLPPLPRGRDAVPHRELPLRRRGRRVRLHRHHLRARQRQPRHRALRHAARLRGVRRPLPKDAQDPARRAGRGDAAPVRAGGGPLGRHPGADRLGHGPREPGGLPHRPRQGEGHHEGRRPQRHPHHARAGGRGDDARQRDAARPVAHPELRQRREGGGGPQGEPGAHQDARARRAEPGGARELPEQQGAVPAGRRARHHQRPAERHHQDLHRGLGGADAADPHRQHLRHELRRHAGTALDGRLPVRPRADGDLRRGAGLLLQAERVAL